MSAGSQHRPISGVVVSLASHSWRGIDPRPVSSPIFVFIGHIGMHLADFGTSLHPPQVGLGQSVNELFHSVWKSRPDDLCKRILWMPCSYLLLPSFLELGYHNRRGLDEAIKFHQELRVRFKALDDVFELIRHRNVRFGAIALT